MKSNDIKNIVDKNIINLLNEGNGFLNIKEDLKARVERFKLKLSKEFPGVDIDLFLSNSDLCNDIKQTKARYYIYYISSCGKRVNDINWIIENRLRFYSYNSLQTFNLIRLKDKLSLCL